MALQLARLADIDRLSEELILNVFELLRGNSRQALLSATRVSRKWHRLAQSVIDNTIGPLILSAGTEDVNLALFKRLHQNQSLRQGVHHVVIEDWYLQDISFHCPHAIPWEPPGSDPYDAGGYFSEIWPTADNCMFEKTGRQVKALAKALDKMCLATFTWRAMPVMPRIITDVLSRQSQCKIHIEKNGNALETAKWSYTPYLNTFAIDCLVVDLSKLLHALDVMVPAFDNSLLRSLGRLAHGCPSLRSYKVQVISRMWDDMHVPVALKHTEASHVTVVRSLDWLLPASIDAARPLNLAVLELNNFCFCQADEHALHGVIEWSTLRALETDCIALLKPALSRSHKLKRLRIKINSGRGWTFPVCSTQPSSKDMHKLFMSPPPITDLTIINGTRHLQGGMLDNLGGSLTSLIVHEETPSGWPLPDLPLLSKQAIKRLGTLYPRLSHLDLDTPYADREYYALLKSVCDSGLYLRTLSLYRQMGWRETEDGPFARTASILENATKDAEMLRSQIPSLNTLYMNIESDPPWPGDMQHLGSANVHLRQRRHFVIDLERSGNLVVSKSPSLELAEALKKCKLQAAGPFPKYWESMVQDAEFLANNETWYHTKLLQD